MTIQVSIKNETTGHIGSVGVQMQDPDFPSEGLWDEDKPFFELAPGQIETFVVWKNQQIHIKEL